MDFKCKYANHEKQARKWLLDNKLAARDLDNDWNVNGNYGVMFRIEDANPNFDQLCVKSVIPMCVRSEILKRPEDYAVADVAIKE